MAENQIPNWLILKKFIDEETCQVADQYMNLAIKNDTAVHGHVNQYKPNGNCWDLYCSAFTDSLGLIKTPEVNKIINGNASLSYTMLRQYDQGSKLQWHRDRWQCLYSLSVQISREPWGIEFAESGRDLHAGRHSLLLIERGDAVFYLGPQVFHSRKVLPHSKHIQIFLHYVEKGSDIDTKDGRIEYGLARQGLANKRNLQRIANGN